MRLRALVGAVAVSLISIPMMATPAYANDVTIKIDLASTAVSPDARTDWDDLTDTLCVKANSRWHAYGKFRRPSGRWVTVHADYGDGRVCSGNLSIKEDYQTTLHLYFHAANGNTYHKKKSFYT